MTLPPFCLRRLITSHVSPFIPPFTVHRFLRLTSIYPFLRAVPPQGPNKILRVNRVKKEARARIRWYERLDCDILRHYSYFHYY